ncbi:MAG: GNAT family N-acetyltransferase [archaeon]
MPSLYCIHPGNVTKHKTALEHFLKRYPPKVFEQTLTSLYSERFRGNSFAIWVHEDEEDGGIDGILPLVREDFSLFSRYQTWGSLGVIPTDEFVDAVKKKLGPLCVYISLNEMGEEEERTIPDKDRNPDHAVTFIFPFPGKNEEDMWTQDLQKESRNLVRKAKKNGLTTEFIKGVDSVDQLGEFYRLYEERMERFGSPAYPIDYFTYLFSECEESFLCLVRHDKEVVASAVMIGHGNRLANPYAAAKREALNLAPNNMLYWEMLRFGLEHQYELFDMGPSLPDDPVAKFKRSMGGVIRPYETRVVVSHLLYGLFRLTRKMLSKLKRLGSSSRQ